LIISILLIITVAGFIVAAFFMPWISAATSVARVSEQVTNTMGPLGALPFVDKIITGVKEGTDIVRGVGDMDISTTVSGYNIPKMVNLKSSKVALSFVQNFFGDTEGLDKKSMLVYLLPIFAILCMLLAIIGIKYRIAVILMLILSGAILTAGFTGSASEDLPPAEKKEPLASNSTIVRTAALTLTAFLLSAVNISREPENSLRQAPDYSIFLKGTLFKERETPLAISNMFSSGPELPRPLVPELVEFIKTHPINLESKQALNILNQNFVWEGRGTEVVSLDDVLGLCAPVFRILNVDEEMKIWLLNMFQRYMRQPGLSDKERVARALLEYAPYLIDRGPTDKVRLQAVDALFALDENAGPEILSRLFYSPPGRGDGGRGRLLVVQ